MAMKFIIVLKVPFAANWPYKSVKNNLKLGLAYLMLIQTI